MSGQLNPVIPAKAGTSSGKGRRLRREAPAFAGVTIRGRDGE
jgi:hypothetical protein